MICMWLYILGLKFTLFLKGRVVELLHIHSILAPHINYT